MLNKTVKETKKQNINNIVKMIFIFPTFIAQNIRKKTVLSYFLTFALYCILTLSIFFNSLMSITANAQADFLFDEQIKAQAITRFWEGFTEHEIRLFWAPFQWEMV